VLLTRESTVCVRFGCGWEGPLAGELHAFNQREGKPVSVPRYHLDRFGTYLGFVDESGRYFDRSGCLRGSVNDAGKVYDETGSPRGHIDTQGQVWDEQGSYRGYLLRRACWGS